MSTFTQTHDEAAIGLTDKQSAGLRSYQAWVARSAKQPMVLQTIDLEPLGAEDVEVAVEHCGARASAVGSISPKPPHNHFLLLRPEL